MFQYQSTFSSYSVNDMAATQQFYRDTLGVEVEETPQGTKLKLPGGNDIFLYQKDNHQPATFTVLNFVVADIDAAVEQLKQKGVTFERYPEMNPDEDIMRGKDADQGPNIAWFEDPAGNVLSIIED